MIPHPFGSRTRDEIKALAAQCAGDITRLLHEVSQKTETDVKTAAVETDPRARQIVVGDDQESFDQLCRERRWSDGLPLVPPTPERVARLLTGTRRDPQKVIALLAPAYGAATVEKIAINAAMTGCNAAQMPLLIAAVEALADPEFNLQGIQATTNSATPLVIVSGPLAQELGFNSGINCLGQGVWMNATLGRAIHLMLQNIGGALPGEMDQATQGQPGKFTFCCAENQAGNPWEALHVERGMGAGDSAITVVGASGTLNMNTHAKDADDLLRVIADTMIHPTSNDYWFGGEPWIVMGPEHAAVLKEARLDKPMVQRRLWELSRMPGARFAQKDFDRTRHTRLAELGDTGGDSLFPISPDPGHIGIVVAGGPGTHSVYVPTFGNTRAVTRRITG